MSDHLSKAENEAQDTQSLNQRLSELKQLLQERADQAVPEVAKLSSQIEASLHQLGQNAKLSAAELRERARLMKHASDRYARDQPWQVAGMALGLGAVLGYLMGRSKK